MRRRGGPLDGEERPNKRARLDDGIVPVIEPTSFQDLRLPLEIWLMIFQRLDNLTDLQRLNRVCKDFNELINANYGLWFDINWLKYDYHFFKEKIDAEFEYKKIWVLPNGDVSVIFADGTFKLLPPLEREWRTFQGHLDPNNFHVALPVKSIISLHYNQLATCAEDGTRIWNRLTGDLVQYLPPQHDQDKPFRLLCTSHNHLISASPEGSIYLYPNDHTPAIPFTYDKEMERGELKKILYWHDQIVGDFEKVIVTWNRYGREPCTRIIKSELEAKLNALASSYMADLQMLDSEQFSDNDLVHFNNPANKGIRFNWNFYFWNQKVEVFLNETFCFVVDLFGTSAPVFIGTHTRRCNAYDENKSYAMLHHFGTHTYRAGFCFDTKDPVFKYPLEIHIVQPVKFFSMLINHHAIFVLNSGELINWDIRNDIVLHLSLEVPDMMEEELDLFYYGDDAWRFHSLADELMGIHSSGHTLIWDTTTGYILQHFIPPYACDPTYVQHMLRFANNNILVQRRDIGGVDEDGEEIAKQEHVCIYRFLPPPTDRQLEDALEEDFDIIPPSPKR